MKTKEKFISEILKKVRKLKALIKKMDQSLIDDILEIRKKIENE